MSADVLDLDTLGDVEVLGDAEPGEFGDILEVITDILVAYTALIGSGAVFGSIALEEADGDFKLTGGLGDAAAVSVESFESDLVTKFDELEEEAVTVLTLDADTEFGLSTFLGTSLELLFFEELFSEELFSECEAMDGCDIPGWLELFICWLERWSLGKGVTVCSAGLISCVGLSGGLGFSCNTF